MSRRAALVGLLADGEYHSGEALAARLGVTRAAVSKQVRALADWGLECDSAPRRGHRLAAPLDLLDAAALEAALGPAARTRCAGLALHAETDSTNARLLAAPAPSAGAWRGCVAEFQTAGRGRRGRPWLAPYASGLCLSHAWTFADPPPGLSAYGLAVGVAVLRALRRHGVPGLALKWPNDVLCDGRKLGGILCELRAEAAGPAFVVAGIGLNVRLPGPVRTAIAADGGLEPTDVASACAGAPPARTALAAALFDELTAAAAEFAAHGFAAFEAEWSHADALRDRPVAVHGAGPPRPGRARGIAADGSLRVEFDGRVEPVASGEVTLRPLAARGDDP